MALFLLGSRIAVFAGGQTGVLSESPVKVGSVVKSALQGDLQNGILIVFIHQQGNGFLNALGNNITPQRDPEKILKQGR